MGEREDELRLQKILRALEEEIMELQDRKEEISARLQQIQKRKQMVEHELDDCRDFFEKEGGSNSEEERLNVVLETLKLRYPHLAEEITELGHRN